jgi:hypothetical protein
MIVMPGNNTGKNVKKLWEMYPGKLGAMISVRAGGGDGWSNVAVENVPYAIDNGRYAACIHQREWSRDSFLRLLEKASKAERSPLFITVPDVVGSAAQTLDEWEVWTADKSFNSFGFPLAFVAQDGISVDDIPDAADVVFIGGTPSWKKKMIWPVCQRFQDVHVGGINTVHGLWLCENCGAESCDGTGWLRGPERMIGLKQYLYRSNMELGQEQMTLFHLWESETRGGRFISPDMTSSEASRLETYVERGITTHAISPNPTP